MLNEDAAVVGAVGADIGVDLGGRGLPPRRELELAMHRSQSSPAVCGHPAKELRRGEVPRLASHLPDAAIGLTPGRERALHLPAERRPHALWQMLTRAHVQIDRVEQRTPGVVLALQVRAVADPHRPRPFVPREVVERLLAKLALAVD